MHECVARSILSIALIPIEQLWCDCSLAAYNYDVCGLFNCCATHHSAGSIAAPIAAVRRDAANSAPVVTVSPAVTVLAREAREKVVSDDELSITTEFSALNITIDTLISKTPTNIKLSSKWELYHTLLRLVPAIHEFRKAINILHID